MIHSLCDGASSEAAISAEKRGGFRGGAVSSLTAV
eukprot:CAMPEP_0206331150 /NCGR_PEP_ID=MMETSP0106_2-20121207/24093_1 /ASSEMBLY_ACC=CAM_ASM_000206 /TAXON_ID=81532 /ORGANISM="Acanthoeca-like sp., Strain 10tr" /LENGTH=34 /DNA_ID= /DNA_START= /DNA_END= /DNA_ORIENTATION=